MRRWLLESRIAVPAPIEEVFAFFADPTNLEVLTPAWLSLRVLSETSIAMRAGATIDYRLGIRGVPLRWRSEITVWDPPRRFVDEQRRGPYRLWIHEHDFVADGDRTTCADRVSFVVPGGPLAPLLASRFVVPDVERMFAFRRLKLAELFGARVPADPGAGIRVTRVA